MKVFLSLLFLLPDGRIIPGNEIHGWNDTQQPSMEVCLERSKYIFEHPENKPKWALSMVSFCRSI